jgi:hypothetical protein
MIDDETLQATARAWDDYQSLVASISDAALERPNTVGHWSGRDLITHIANWEEYCTWLIQQWDAGREKLWTYEFDINDMARWDIFNEERVTPFRARSLEEVRAYIARTHEQLIAAVAASPHVTVSNLEAMTSGHYEWHVGDLQGIVQIDAE